MLQIRSYDEWVVGDTGLTLTARTNSTGGSAVYGTPWVREDLARRGLMADWEPAGLQGVAVADTAPPRWT
jgi:hypothetical protein